MHPGDLAEAGAHSLSLKEFQTFVNRYSTSRGSGHGMGAPSLLANVSELGLPLAASFLPQPLLPAWDPNVGLLLGSRSNSTCMPAQWCLTFCYPMDYSPPGSCVHGILQARKLEWVAMPSCR